MYSSNVVLKTVFSCFAISQDFNQLCYLYGVSVMCMNFSELTCVVYENFRTSTMWSSFFISWWGISCNVCLSVRLSVCLSVFHLCWVLYSVFVTNKRINIYIHLAMQPQKSWLLFSNNTLVLQHINSLTVSNVSLQWQHNSTHSRKKNPDHVTSPRRVLSK